jgi:hypothetical protein
LSPDGSVLVGREVTATEVKEVVRNGSGSGAESESASSANEREACLLVAEGYAELIAVVTKPPHPRNGRKRNGAAMTRSF